jgi:mannose-6-phosphate isomerase-like protein (cupin superfamily)
LEIIKIEENERGATYKILFEDKEYHLIKTVKAEMRFGHYHNLAQHVVVLQGRILMFTKTCLICPEGSGEGMKIVEENEVMHVPANVPHKMVSWSQSIILEWFDGGALETTDYAEFKKQVDAPIELS